MAPQRVLMIIENLPVPFDRRAWAEARALAAAGYEVSVICPQMGEWTAPYEVLDGIEIYRHPLRFEARGALGYVLEYCEALAREFWLSIKIRRRGGFDIIHACNPPDTIFLIAAFYKLLFGCKFVFDHHDLNPELYEAKFGRRGLGWRLLCLLERLTFKLADISIATNESYRRVAIERGGMAPDRVTVVRSGPDLSRVQAVEPDPALRRGRRFLVGYVGVIGEQEGIDLLLGAVDHIVRGRDRRDVSFTIVGSGPALADMQALSERMGLSDYVAFTGRVDDQTLFATLSTADVCVNPDRVTEMNDKSTMNKIMEYMALGKPIVQFDLKEGRFSAQEASLYARADDVSDFGDKILSLLDDPARACAMGEAGRQRVHTTLAWAYEAPKLVRAYERLEKPVRAPALAQRSKNA